MHSQLSPCYRRTAVDLVGSSRYDAPPMQISLSRTELLLLMLIASLSGCATGHYTPLDEAGNNGVEQLKENVYRVEYQMSAFTSQEQLDRYLRRRCAELTLREGYDYFHQGGRLDVLGLSRRTAITVTLYKNPKPVGIPDLQDAKDVLAETAVGTKAD